MNILYIHGFGSKVDTRSSKYRVLNKLGTVHGFAPMYELGLFDVSWKLCSIIIEKKIDLIVGTSMGGFLASNLAWTFGIPYVALNPVIRPTDTLKKFVGVDQEDYYGRKFDFTEEMFETYSNDMFQTKSSGIVFIENGDEVIDVNSTIAFLKKNDVNVVVLNGGSHRFDSLGKVVKQIEDVYNKFKKA